MQRHDYKLIIVITLILHKLLKKTFIPFDSNLLQSCVLLCALYNRIRPSLNQRCMKSLTLDLEMKFFLGLICNLVKI